MRPEMQQKMEQAKAARGLHKCSHAATVSVAQDMSAHLTLWVPKLAPGPHRGNLDGLHVPLLIVQRVVWGGAGGIHAHLEVRLAHCDLCMPAHAALRALHGSTCCAQSPKGAAAAADAMLLCWHTQRSG